MGKARMRRTSAPNGFYVSRALSQPSTCVPVRECISFKAIRSLIAFGQYKRGWSEPLKISKVSEWKKTKEPTQVLKILKKS